MNVKSVMLKSTEGWEEGKAPKTRVGTTKTPCCICGKHYYHRIRIVVEREDKTQKVVHVCIRGCDRKVFNRQMFTVKAGKITKGKRRWAWKTCVHCNTSKVQGGLWVKSYNRDTYHMCKKCLLKHIDSGL